MGGCCCHNDDAKEEDGEEKCIFVGSEEHDPSRIEYGSLSTMEDKRELEYMEPPEIGQGTRQSSSQDEASCTPPKGEESDQEQSPANDVSVHVHVSHSGASLQEVPEIQQVDKEELASLHGDDTPEPAQTDDMSQGEVDKEIDQLVAAVMASKAVYPPSATPEESSMGHSRQLSPGHQAFPTPAQGPPSDQEAGSDSETTPTKRVGLLKKTQMSIKRAKARASTIVSMSSRNASAEQIEKKHQHLEKRTSNPERKKPNSRDEMTSSHTGKRTGTRKKVFAPGEKMKSHYAKDRVAQFEVERDIRDKLASHRAANDPRKAALERGERLGQLDDTIDEMKDQSSSFAQVARQLRDEQRDRTSTFPW